MKFTARHFASGKAVELSIRGSAIESIVEREDVRQDAELPIVSPGFFDIQVNGFGGTWFCSPTLSVKQVITVCEALVNRGISRMLPTLITASHEALVHGFTVLEQARAADELVRACVVGYHLEGPFISPEDGPRGAHPRRHVRPASFEEFQRLQETANGRIRLVTLAADAEGAIDFIRRCRAQGVQIAIGHTGGATKDIHAAVDAGAGLSTHLGNGAHGVLPRHPNYLWDQLADDRLQASIIADGWHLPDAVLQCIWKCKGLERTVLTCDVSGFAGCPPGIYHEDSMKIEVLDDGRLVVAGQRQFLAGSGVTTGDCVVHMMDVCGLSLQEAVRLATQNPSEFLGDTDVRLIPGSPATLSVFQIQNAYFGGKRTFVPIATYTNGRVLSSEP